MHAKRWAVGRKKQWTERLTLPLDKETLDRIDAVRAEGEARLDVIREGIALTLKKRERQKPSKPEPAA
jgi:hypothetical protein